LEKGPQKENKETFGERFSTSVWHERGKSTSYEFASIKGRGIKGRHARRKGRTRGNVRFHLKKCQRGRKEKESERN